MICSSNRPDPAGLEPSSQYESSFILSCVASGNDLGFLVFGFPFYDKTHISLFASLSCFASVTWKGHRQAPDLLFCQEACSQPALGTWKKLKNYLKCVVGMICPDVCPSAAQCKAQCKAIAAPRAVVGLDESCRVTMASFPLDALTEAAGMAGDLPGLTL